MRQNIIASFTTVDLELNTKKTINYSFINTLLDKKSLWKTCAFENRMDSQSYPLIGERQTDSRTRRGEFSGKYGDLRFGDLEFVEDTGRRSQTLFLFFNYFAVSQPILTKSGTDNLLGSESDVEGSEFYNSERLPWKLGNADFEAQFSHEWLRFISQTL